MSDDIGAMQEEIADLLQKAWDKGRVYGEAKVHTKGEWIKCISPKIVSVTMLDAEYFVKCPFCGLERRTETNYCQDCGARLKS